MRTEHVSVGVDESQAAVAAVCWGAGLASAMGTTLKVIHAWRMPMIAMLPESVGGLPDPEFMIAQSSALVDKVLGESGIDRSEVVTVTPNVAPGDAMVYESAPDVIVVVGRTGNGKGRFARLVLGSTTHHVAHHAQGPLVVVPDDCSWGPSPHIVVGVDGSESSLDALAWVIDEMPAGSSLEARHVVAPWGDPYAWGDDTLPEEVEALLKLELSSWIANAQLRSSDPERTVSPRVVIGEARWALAPLADQQKGRHENAGADIVVVGHRSRNPVAQRVLGSVADYLVREAAVPVIVHRGNIDS